MRADIRGVELYFDIDGASLIPEGSQMRERPTAFLVHGGPGSDHVGYKLRYMKLKERMQLVYFDHRGQGRSSRGDVTTHNLDENVEDMESLRRYLGLGPIVSIGGSYGGMVALAHAARYPTSVSHLIVFATVAHAGYATRALEIAAERGTPAQRGQCEDFFSGRIDTTEKMQKFLGVMGPLYACNYDAAAAKLGQNLSILSPEAQNRAHGPGGFLRSFDLRPELRAITAPTLILAGRHDWICAPEFSEEIHQLIPGSDLRIFEHSSHSLVGDEPQNFFDAIAGFLVYNHRKSGRS